MKKIVLFILLYGAQICFGQWEALEGPYGGFYFDIASAQNNLIVYKNNKIFVSTDEGNSWSISLTVVGEQKILRVLFNQQNKVTYGISSNSRNGEIEVYTSIDFGSTWTFLKTFNNFSNIIDVNITLKNIYLIEYQKISYCTLNNPDSLIVIPIPFKYDKYAIDFDDVLFFHTDSLIQRTTNLGKDFSVIGKSKYYDFDFKLDKNNVLYYTDLDLSGFFVYYSTDKGDTWELFKKSYDIFGIFYAIDTNHIFCKDYRDYSIYLFEKEKSNQVTYIWTKISSLDIKKILQFGNKFVVSTNKTFYLADDIYLNNYHEIKLALQIVYNLQGGKHLLIARAEDDYKLTANKFIDKVWASYFLFVSNKDYFWSTHHPSINSNGWFSTDGGITLRTPDTLRMPCSMVEGKNNKLYALFVNSASFFVSYDQLNWRTVFIERLGYSQILLDSSEKLMIFSMICNSSIYRDSVGIIKMDSSDYHVVSQIYTTQIHKFVQALITPNNYYYARSDSVLYRSTDEGMNWKVIFDGTKQNMAIRDFISVNNSIHLATIKGILTTDDYGNNWYNNNDGLRTYDCYSLGKTADNTLYAGFAYDVVYRNTKMTNIREVGKIEPVLFLSPNPAADYIEISVGAQGTVSDIRIFNVFGETVKNPTQTLPEGEGLRIDVSGLPSGVYFLRVGEKVRKFLKI